jgi:7-alpha-hydroxysteroid dehydrogenase
MAKRPSTPGDLREAVERTVQATLGSAERQRERTQGALDDLAGTVDQLRRGAEAGIARGRRAIEDRRPATSEDIRELKAEIRRIGRRLDAIEERLPAKRSGGKRSASSGGGAKRSSSGGAKPSSGGAKPPSGGAKPSGGGAKPSGGRRSS